MTAAGAVFAQGNIVDGGFYRGPAQLRSALPSWHWDGPSALGGVQNLYEHLKNELIMTMQLADTPLLKSISPECVERAEV